jgi:hypothetical protein
MVLDKMMMSRNYYLIKIKIELLQLVKQLMIIIEILVIMILMKKEMFTLHTTS